MSQFFIFFEMNTHKLVIHEQITMSILTNQLHHRYIFIHGGPHLLMCHDQGISVLSKYPPSLIVFKLDNFVKISVYL